MQRMHVSKLQLQPYASQDPLRLACLSKVASVTHLAVVGGSQGEAPGTCLCYEGKGTIPQSPSLSPFVAAAAPSWLPNEDKNQRATELARWEDLARMLASHAPFPTIKLSCIPGYAVPAFLSAFSKGFRELYVERCTRFSIHRDSQSTQRLRKALRENNISSTKLHLSIGPLRQEDADLVNNNWSFKSHVSLELVQDLIASKITSCARLLQPETGKQGAPVSWIVQQFDGSIGMAHTLAPFRKQGDRVLLPLKDGLQAADNVVVRKHL